MLLSIITLNYKKSALTIACMESLQEHFANEFKQGQVELIVVDNDSQDDSVKKIKEAIEKANYKNVRLIANKNNDGFGKGCNVGAKTAKGKYLLFLNNDTVAKDKGIVKMAQYLEEHEEVAILGGQMRNDDGSLQQSTEKFYTPFYALLLLLGMQRFDSPTSFNAVSRVDWVKGGLFMIRNALFAKLQGFDENIFMYVEDMELCYRASKLGLKTYFYPEVTVLHKEHGSGNRTFAIVNIYKNLLYFYKKHRSKGDYLFVKTVMRTKATFMIAIGKILRNNYLIQTYEQALKVI